MRIFVCVKQVPDTSGKVAVNPDGTLNRNSMAAIVNPDDMIALEQALKLKDELACQVTAVTMGPPQAEAMLREILAIGADDAVLDRKSTRLNSSHANISYAVFCLKKKKDKRDRINDDDFVSPGHY